MIDRPDLVDDEHLVPNLLDINYAAEVDAVFFPWVLSRTKQEAMEAGQAVGVPVSALNTIRDVFADPQFTTVSSSVEVDHPEAGTTRLPTCRSACSARRARCGARRCSASTRSRS